ncbi:hypothetical protein B0H15DRAFT_177085 [Mycena belliarum]|uniref:Uncharacterized protein n=1 Tax=Mycena belliarum TaxID=1033014 RepID=A0AAD6XDB4_9AGAR|nr:hypothetical protein B0H15DRAFT_177085 [Mycena belliae]
MNELSKRRRSEAAGIEGTRGVPVLRVQMRHREPPSRSSSRVGIRLEDARAVTCRQCKQLDHLPRSCKGGRHKWFRCARYQLDFAKQKWKWTDTLDGRHIVEEVMTQAFKRECPCRKKLNRL